MWYILLGYLLLSSPFAILIWVLLIVAKRKNEGEALDTPEELSEEKRTAKYSSVTRS